MFKGEWAFEKDKKGHLTIGAGIAAALLLLSMSFIEIMIGVVMVALAKEFYDNFHPEIHTVSFADFVYTVVGGLIGVGLGSFVGGWPVLIIAIVAFLITQKQ